MSAPAWLENVEVEEWDELAALADTLNVPVADADLDAVASLALQTMAREDAELGRYAAAEKAEHERINARYMMLLLPHLLRRGQAEEIVKECARRAQFVGKSKSRKVGNGVYGRKIVPAKVSIIDKDKALEFARTDCPAAIKEKIEYSVIHAVVASLILARLESSGDFAQLNFATRRAA